MTLTRQIITTIGNPRLHNRKTSWLNFRKQIKETLNTKKKLNNEDDITIAVEHFNNSIQLVAWKSTPITMERDTILNYSQEIREKVADKRKLILVNFGNLIDAPN